MPPYLTRKQNTYYFRQSIPAELRAILGKREIKKSLGRDYVRALRDCKRVAVEADSMLADARAQFDNRPVEPFSYEGIRRTRHIPLTRVTPELEIEFSNLVCAALLETDQETRIAGMDHETFTEYGQHIQDGLAALRRQLAMGDLEPMFNSTREFLIGRGYQPEFSLEDWRRLAYAMTQSTLQAYEGMAARQQGMIILTPTDALLPNQYIVQNAVRTPAVTDDTVTWSGLYATWENECQRPKNTKTSYLAAMTLFTSTCSLPPHEVTRDHALQFRDFLLAQGLNPATVANKIGFIGTLINTGRNSSQYAKHLPNNPFEHVTIKRSMRGKAGDKRLPFNDHELKKIFGSRIFTENYRPKGGSGEAAAWIPAIAYLSGARLEEIALLKTSQFQVDAYGNHYIHIEDGKNKNSADRDFPIHPHLIEAGLLDYVKTCHGRLFPKVNATGEVKSSAFSKWYGRHLSTLGITSPSKVFHSFRHLFKDMCRNAGLNDPVIDQICGHDPGTEGGRYGVGRRVDVLANLLAKVVPPVKLPKITSAQ